MVRIDIERPSQRLHHRVTAPMFVKVANQYYPAEDWSLGGCQLAQLKTDLPQLTETIHCILALPFQGFTISFQVTGTIMRACPQNNSIAIKFNKLGEREQHLMEHFIDELVRGSMTAVEDTIQRIDTPVTPVSTKPDPNPVDTLPVKRFNVRNCFIAALYLSLGFFLFTYMGVTLYSQFVRLEVRTAVVTAPLEVVSAVMDGTVRRVTAYKGDMVKHGIPVLHLSHYKLEAQRQEALLTIKHTAAEIAQWQLRRKQELTRLKDFSLASGSLIRGLESTVSAARSALRVATAKQVRKTTLYEQGHETISNLEAARDQTDAAHQIFDTAEEALLRQKTMQIRAGDRRHFDGIKFVGDLDEVEAKLARAKATIKIAKSKLADIAIQEARLAVSSPFNGTLKELYVTTGSSYSRGDTLAVFEAPSRSVIHAFLNQEEILEIGLGAIASIYVPSTGTLLKGRITSIDRTEGFINEVASSYTWRGPKDRSALVELEIIQSNDIITALVPGHPVTILFQRQKTNPAWAYIKKLFGASND